MTITTIGTFVPCTMENDERSTSSAKKKHTLFGSLCKNYFMRKICLWLFFTIQ